MIKKAIVNIVKEKITEYLLEMGEKHINITDDTSLLEEGGVIDSLAAINILVEVENEINKNGYDFSLIEEIANSDNKYILESVNTLAEFISKNISHGPE